MKTFLTRSLALGLSFAALFLASAESVEACASCREGGVRSKACAIKERVDGLDLEWGAANKKTFAKITQAKQAALLFFVDDKNPSPARSDVADLAKKNLLRGVTVPALSEKEKAASAKEASSSPLPSSKFDQANLWTAYGVSEGGTYVLTDQFGNEVGRAKSSKVRALALGAAKVLKARRKAVTTSSDAAKKLLEGKNFAKAYTQLKAAFAHNLLGYAESSTAEKVYRDWLKSARAEISAAKADEGKLAPLRVALKSTPVESEVPAKKAEVKKSGAKKSKTNEQPSE